MYGHEGSANAVNFSPSGDYFTSAGNDSVVMIWKSNLNQFEQEIIDDFGGKTTAVSAASKEADKEAKIQAAGQVRTGRTTAQMSQTPKCPGPSQATGHCHNKVEVKDDIYDPTYAPT